MGKLKKTKNKHVIPLINLNCCDFFFSIPIINEARTPLYQYPTTFLFLCLLFGFSVVP